jgi:hypothetical protein
MAAQLKNGTTCVNAGAGSWTARLPDFRIGPDPDDKHWLPARQ